MCKKWFMILFICQYFLKVLSNYGPISDKVEPGSVLLPATRRGLYLANIIKRQAVDGTTIKFHKDADRINAEAKKKIDVLSEDVLPYVIAEQERRTTLYRRVMTAIQNGEKGVTIAEIRNKPPAFIRRGIMYRCPSNLAPKEPDGSGVIVCQDDVEPSPIVFDSCLSAEDRDLYEAENKYFFCNRHKTEGPDLPKNGTTVFGCNPSERTPLDYTSKKCTLEDSNDVVVHYRYYPDNSYKFVSELDPDHEICDHWNPCQVGYIFSLPGPDQAVQASELWSDYKEGSDAEIYKEEFVPPIPEDDKNETISDIEHYVTSARTMKIPEGYKFSGLGRYLPNGQSIRISDNKGVLEKFNNIEVSYQITENHVKVSMNFTPFKKIDATTYYGRFQSTKDDTSVKQKYIPFITLNLGTSKVSFVEQTAMIGQILNITAINVDCDKCLVTGVMVRSDDGLVRTMDNEKFRFRKRGGRRYSVELDIGAVTPDSVGDYFLMLQNDNGDIEKIKAFSLKTPDIDVGNMARLNRLTASAEVGKSFEKTVQYSCYNCQLQDVYCNGQSVTSAGKVAIGRKSVSFKFSRFADTDACVYIGVFNKGGRLFQSTIAVIDNGAPGVFLRKGHITAPVYGQQFEQIVQFHCNDCTIDKVTVNGYALQSNARRAESVGFFDLLPDHQLAIRITDFTKIYEGVYQATFCDRGVDITKTVLEIVPNALPKLVILSGTGDVGDRGNFDIGGGQFEIGGGSSDGEVAGSSDTISKLALDDGDSSDDGGGNLAVGTSDSEGFVAVNGGSGNNTGGISGVGSNGKLGSGASSSDIEGASDNVAVNSGSGSNTASGGGSDSDINIGGGNGNAIDGTVSVGGGSASDIEGNIGSPNVVSGIENDGSGKSGGESKVIGNGNISGTDIIYFNENDGGKAGNGSIVGAGGNSSGNVVSGSGSGSGNEGASGNVVSGGGESDGGVKSDDGSGKAV